MNIEEIRKKIDAIDTRIVELIRERNLLMPEIAQYKKEHNLSLTNLEREQKIIEEKRKMAEDLNVNPQTVEDIFKLLFAEAKRVQEDSTS